MPGATGRRSSRQRSSATRAADDATQPAAALAWQHSGSSPQQPAPSGLAPSWTPATVKGLSPGRSLIPGVDRLADGSVVALPSIGSFGLRGFGGGGSVGGHAFGMQSPVHRLSNAENGGGGGFRAPLPPLPPAAGGLRGGSTCSETFQLRLSGSSFQQLGLDGCAVAAPPPAFGGGGGGDDGFVKGSVRRRSAGASDGDAVVPITVAAAAAAGDRQGPASPAQPSALPCMTSVALTAANIEWLRNADPVELLSRGLAE